MGGLSCKEGHPSYHFLAALLIRKLRTALRVEEVKPAAAGLPDPPQKEERQSGAGRRAFREGLQEQPSPVQSSDLLLRLLVCHKT